MLGLFIETGLVVGGNHKVFFCPTDTSEFHRYDTTANPIDRKFDSAMAWVEWPGKRGLGRRGELSPSLTFTLHEAQSLRRGTHSAHFAVL